MVEKLDERISYYESPSYTIAKALEDKGYKIADSTGMRIDEPRHDVLGILEPQEAIKKSFLGFKYNKEQRALYEGILWMDNDSRGAKHNENWVLEVYGRSNVPKLTELVKKLSEPKEISVQIRLESEHTREEVYSSDYE